MRIISIWFLVLFSVAACSSNSADKDEFVYAKIDAQAFYLNEVTLGDDASDVINKLGAATLRKPLKDGHELISYSALYVLLRNNKIVNIICRHRCSMPNAIAIGASRSDLVDAYGQGSQTQAGDTAIISYPVQGQAQMLLFTMFDGQVAEIELWQEPEE